MIVLNSRFFYSLAVLEDKAGENGKIRGVNDKIGLIIYTPG